MMIVPTASSVVASVRWCANKPPTQAFLSKLGIAGDVQGDLKEGAAMPPLLQYNEDLVHAALSLVEVANRVEGGLTDAQDKALGDVLDFLFSETPTPIRDMLTKMRRLASSDLFGDNPEMLAHVNAVCGALVPSELTNVYLAIDGLGDKANDKERAAFDHLAGLIVEGNEDDDDMTNALKRCESDFKRLFEDTSFIVLLKSMSDLLLQSRISYLITKACHAFDEEHTGRIKVAELRESLGQVVPAKVADAMIAKVEADDDGTIYYPQLASMLLRGTAREDVTPTPQQ